MAAEAGVQPKYLLLSGKNEQAGDQETQTGMKINPNMIVYEKANSDFQKVKKQEKMRHFNR